MWPVQPQLPLGPKPTLHSSQGGFFTIILTLCLWFSTGGDFAPEEIWQYLEILLLVATGG